MKLFSLSLTFLLLSTSLYAILPSTLSTKSQVSQHNDLKNKVDQLQVVKSDPTKWAIIIAPEVYDETDDVVYSKNTGEIFATLAHKKLGVSQRRTYALIGEDATTGKIKNKLNTLLKYVQKGDTIYFYYSGHGIPDIATREAYILPKDLDPAYISSEKVFKLSNIYKRLEHSKADKVIAFVDSCFSGATDNKTVFKGVAAPRVVSKKQNINKSKMVVLTAGSEKQFSNGYKSKKIRLFSYFLMQNIADGDKDIETIFTNTKKSVESVSFEIGDQYYQSPTLEGNIRIKL